MKKIYYALMVSLCGNLIGVSLILGSCDYREPNELPSSLEYFYDSVHEVSIWKYGQGEAKAVLPADQVKNPELPMER